MLPGVLFVISLFALMVPVIALRMPVMMLLGVFMSFGISAMLGVRMRLFVSAILGMVLVVLMFVPIVVLLFHFLLHLIARSLLFV